VHLQLAAQHALKPVGSILKIDCTPLGRLMAVCKVVKEEPKIASVTRLAVLKLEAPPYPTNQTSDNQDHISILKLWVYPIRHLCSWLKVRQKLPVRLIKPQLNPFITGPVKRINLPSKTRRSGPSLDSWKSRSRRDVTDIGESGFPISIGVENSLIFCRRSAAVRAMWVV